ncbi:error-prone repair protein UmuD [Mucilaginibacter limnophilus]|uniref:Error-prone repair protein UmuD n=1 Tax=Mucilaginibacter limnophilus TaxID=1932778 RepID=A0A437MUD0_9SPHI|nr:S24 family peptidase [Mucilaginibacter limnophilus]RVU01282.1 error-prone repair protein UmuD [Mucilaginibacter limnophilus]
MIRVLQQRAEQKIMGFQSPANDYLEGRLNIADILVIDPHCTYYFQMDSAAMKNYGIRSGDILVIDKSLTPIDGTIVVAFIHGCYYCRVYELQGNKPALVGEEDRIETTDGEVLQIWGVVTSICRNMLPAPLRKGKYKRVCTL